MLVEAVVDISSSGPTHGSGGEGSSNSNYSCGSPPRGSGSTVEVVIVESALI